MLESITAIRASRSSEIKILTKTCVLGADRAVRNCVLGALRNCLNVSQNTQWIILQKQKITYLVICIIREN